MNDTADVLTTVRGAFKSAFDVDPRLVSVETSPSDIPGWDSVGHLSLASELEQAFGISLDVDELIEMESVREIVRIIWPAPGSEDTELGVLMEPEVGHGETEVYARVQA